MAAGATVESKPERLDRWPVTVAFVRDLVNGLTRPAWTPWVVRFTALGKGWVITVLSVLLAGGLREGVRRRRSHPYLHQRNSVLFIPIRPLKP